MSSQVPPLKLPLRIAMIGSGAVARHHFPAFRDRPDILRLSAICEKNPSAASAFAAQFPYSIPIFAELDDLLDKAQVEAALVVQPHNLHFPNVNSTGGLKHWLLDGKAAGGGVVVSLAVHQLDLIRFITGDDFVEATAWGRFDSPFQNGAESCALALLKMTKGACGVLHATYTGPRVPYCENEPPGRASG